MQVEERGELSGRGDRRHGPSHAAHRRLREQAMCDARCASSPCNPFKLEPEPGVELTPAVDWPVAVCGERSLRERPQPPRLSLRFEHVQSSLLETELIPVSG